MIIQYSNNNDFMCFVIILLLIFLFKKKTYRKIVIIKKNNKNENTRTINKNIIYINSSTSLSAHNSGLSASAI